MTPVKNQWYALDNSAKFYPIIMLQDRQSSFRCVARLNGEIQSDKLSDAINLILPRFSSFQVKLKRGLFWYYFEQNNEKCKVEHDDGVILRPITNYDNNKFLFRVMYYECNIVIEFFHVLCDGMGALEFMKALVYEYLRQTGKAMPDTRSIITIDSTPSFRETEDSFEANYDPIRLREVNISEVSGDSATLIKGTPTQQSGLGVLKMEIPVNNVVAIAKEYGCSITVLVGAVLLNAIYTVNYKKPILKKPLLLFIPINLRKYFNSATLRNFVLYSRAGVGVNTQPLKLEDFIVGLKEGLAKDTQHEAVQSFLNKVVRLQRAALTRLMPLFLKNIFIRYGKRLWQTNKHTAPLSNMGKIELPPEIEPYVEDLYYVMNCSREYPLACYVNSIRSHLNVVISRNIIENEIEREFVRFFTDRDVPVTVAGNYWEL